MMNDSDGAGVNYELGMKFKSSVNGKLTAIKFYKASKESGVHVGRIWSSSGAQLASVTFSNESASGWQIQKLSAPLSISANTVYVITVNTGNSYYVDTVNGLANSVSNGPLKTIVGNNGVFGSVGKFPTRSWNASSYFRDVMFQGN